MDNLKQEEQVTVEAAEAEKVVATSELKKFKDVQTLIKAYTDLEAEFTRRSQRLKELENKENKVQSVPDEAKGVPSPNEDEITRLALSNGKIRERIIGEYLKNVTENKTVPLISGGVSVTAPKVTPKSVKEAGKLALEFLNRD